MKLRIVSDGYGHGTHVATESGEKISGIQKIEWTIDGANGRSMCRLTVADVHAAIDAIEVELKQAPAPTTAAPSDHGSPDYIGRKTRRVFALDVGCPECGAEIGDACLDATEDARAPHDRRVTAALDAAI